MAENTSEKKVITDLETKTAETKEAEKESSDTKENGKDKKARASEPDLQNNLAPLSLFDEKPGSIDYVNHCFNSLNKILSNMGKGKTIDELFINSFFAVFDGLMDFLLIILKEQQKKAEEAAKKAEQNRTSYIDNSLKSKGMTKVSIASELSYRTQEWLNDDSMLPHNADGSIQISKLNPIQRFHYKKLKFAESLPLVPGENVYDFSKFSSAQRRKYTYYIKAYAVKNSEFARYVAKTFATLPKTKEIQQIIKVATDMSLRYNAGLKYQRFAQRERAA